MFPDGQNERIGRILRIAGWGKLIYNKKTKGTAKQAQAADVRLLPAFLV